MDISNLQVQIVQTMMGQYTPEKRGELKLHSFYKDAEHLNHYQFLIMSIEQLALNRVTILQYITNPNTFPLTKFLGIVIYYY